jgi:hypothetical protein
MLGPLQFREFRLLFAARAISLTGSAIAPIALAFGVLQATGEATDLGIVLFARQAIETVLLLGGGVLAIAGTLFVLVPLRARQSYGGAGAYGLLIAIFSVGALCGGALMLRVHPGRPLVVATLGILVIVPDFVLLAIGAPLAVVLFAALLGGLGTEVSEVLWVTTMQREIPPDRLSRVSSYDALGSFVFTPVGLALAAPVAIAVGLSGAFWIGAALLAVPTLLILGVGDVRRMRSSEPASARSSS